MESLRDGLEDYEYLKLYERKAGRAAANAQVARIIGKPKTVYSGGKPTFPSYPSTASSYNAVRSTIAKALSQ